MGEGNLSVTAQPRYAFVKSLIERDLPPPARVVEFGAAPGDQIVGLAKLGYTCTSIDLGTSSDDWGAGEVGRMKRILAEASVADVTWNLEETPYPVPDAAFDAVIMTEVLEHLRDYPIQSLHEAFRVLKPGGRLYLTTPNQAYLLNRLRLLVGRNVQTPLSDWMWGVPFARHAREYTFAEIESSMAQVGFAVIYRSSRHFHVASGRLGSIAHAGKLLLSLVAQARPQLGPQIIVVAQRPISA